VDCSVCYGFKSQERIVEEVMKLKREFECYLVWMNKNENTSSGYKFISHVQMKSWAGKALETVNCYAFLKRRVIGAC
jgi:hypothetical protein